MSTQSRNTNLRSFVAATLLAVAVAYGCGGDAGTAPGAGGRSGVAGKDATLPGVGGADPGGAGGNGSGGLAGGAPSMAIANIVPMNPGTTSGTATFVTTSNGVRLTVKLTNCPQGRHPLYIHAGNACTNATAQGAHWGPTRGENIGPNGGEISCDASLRGTLTYTRLDPDPLTRWTIGDGGMSDLVGHTVVVQALDGMGREGCGVIQLSPAGTGGAAGG
ncbi:MAG TPA: superoxide dismutase family protein, partial [Polyangia bacterium]